MNGLNKIYTVSELETYDGCPREYYLKYVQGMPANEIFKEGAGRLPANIRGSIVHAAIQKYDGDKTVANLIKSECINNLIYPDEKTIGEIETLLAKFAKSDLAKEISNGRRELRFDWKFESSIITGSIDWLRAIDGDFEIIDFKTDRVTQKEIEDRAKEYELQLVAYALAASEALLRPVVQTSLYFLEPDVIHKKEMNERRAGEGKARIAEIISRIEKGEFDSAGAASHCDRCPYKKNKMCPSPL